MQDTNPPKQHSPNPQNIPVALPVKDLIKAKDGLKSAAVVENKRQILREVTEGRHKATHARVSKSAKPLRRPTKSISNS